MLQDNNSEKFIDLKTLSKLLLLSDIRSAQKWCESKNIEIQIIGKKQLVYSFLVDMELDKKLVSELKKKYPQRWEELYRCYRDNDRIGYLLLIDEDPELDFRSLTQRAIPQSRFSKNLAKS
ncbi:hypothetical protein [Flavivirga rizhaonensis]|uniref:Uncharacterized protein n=1 Tax=Flavivirga rizhaonensis TaxID=2559571 RepID=A0A4S1DZD1_9FLAO|nr:hypothetical protein [Flavivirga rizhaonensis]TGV03580.1 hypothetical protein EM932_06005 [Flavivirga rizhaonensis]